MFVESHAISTGERSRYIASFSRAGRLTTEGTEAHRGKPQRKRPRHNALSDFVFFVVVTHIFSWADGVTIIRVMDVDGPVNVLETDVRAAAAEFST